MRVFIGIVVVACATSVVFGADDRDLGVPADWKASEYENRGYDLLNKHDYENARRYFDAAIQIEPDRWSAYYNRATTFCQQKKWAAALQDLNSTIRLAPDFREASFERAAINRQLGNYSYSLTDLNILVKVGFRAANPATEAHALNERAWLRATCPDASMRNGQLAIADAKKACEFMKWRLAQDIDTLAAAYAEAGDFDSAVRYQEQAISAKKLEPEEAVQIMAKQRVDKTVAKRAADKTTAEVKKSLAGFSQRLELYKQHRPYRETVNR